MRGTYADFLQLASRQPQLADELRRLAARFGFQFTEDLTGLDLDRITGGLGGMPYGPDPAGGRRAPLFLSGGSNPPGLSGGAGPRPPEGSGGHEEA